MALPYNYVALSITTAIVAAFLAFYVSKRSVRRDIGLRFSLWTLSIVMISLGDALRKVSLDHDFTLFWTKFTVLGAIVFIPTFAEFCLTFPPKKEPRRSRILYSSIAASVALAVLLPTDIIVHGLVPTPLGWSTDFGAGIFLFGPVFAAFSLVSVTELVRKTHRRAGYYRTHVVALGVLILAGLITTLIPPIQEALYDPPMISILSVAATAILGSLVLRQKFLVIPIAEATSESPRRYSLERGDGYLILEEAPKRSIDILADYVMHGSPGLCITNLPPERIRMDFGLSKTPIFWISELDLPNTIHPTDIETLSFYITSFYGSTNDGIVLLQGLENLVDKNGFPPVWKLVNRLKGFSKRHNGRLIVSLSPGSIDEDAIRQLKSGLTPL